MKPNTLDQRQTSKEHGSLESHLERGRQLHSAAVYAFCALLFKRIQLLRPTPGKTDQATPALPRQRLTQHSGVRSCILTF
jgi:hypothetical protein